MKTIRQLTIATLMVLAGAQNVADAKVKLHTIGDSTMANYATDGSTDKRGWCQMLQQFFNSDHVIVNNRGKSGASSKSFYKEAAYWPTLVTGGSDQMEAGDYLIIQFAHNDEKTGGADGDMVLAYYNDGHQSQFSATPDYRGTTANGTFKEMLRNYINEAKAMQVKPILVGGICRKYFKDNGGKSINASGQHNLYQNFTKCDGTSYSTGNSLSTDDHSLDYPYQMSLVAQEYDDVPFIDLTAGTKELYESYGEAYCTNNLFCKDDATHPAALGATLIARKFAMMFKAQAENETDVKRKEILQALAAEIIVSNEITFNPTSGDLGQAYVGMGLTKEYNISAFGLAAESGTFTIAATEGFKVSADKKSWSQSIEVPYTGSSLIATIYVRATIGAAGTLQGTLTATDGTNSKQLAMTAQGISMSGGEETQCVWSLNSTSLAATSPLLTGMDVSLSGMTATANLATPTSPEGHGKMLLFNIDGGTWPAGEIDEVSTRYIQFQMTVPSDKKLNLDKISLDLCGWGGNSVCYHAYYATKADFSDQTLLDERLNMSNKAAVSISKEVVKELEEGESIYIRIYPWLNVSSAAAGKYLAVSDVTIHGMISEAGGQSINLTGSITYPLVDSDPVMNPAEMAVGMVGCSVAYGNLLTVSANGGCSWSGSDGSRTQTKVANASGSSLPASSVDGNTITYTLTPEDGIVFVPTRISFNAARYGTDGGTITAVVEATGSCTVCDNASINRSGKNLPLMNLTGEVSGVAADASNPLKVKISVLGLGNTKNVGIDNLVIEGTMNGTLQQATKYQLNTIVAPEGAGTISVDPVMANYKEGKEVTLKATKNFGYRFVKWMEGAQELGSNATLQITMNADREITAQYEEVPVYTVNALVQNDAEKNLGNIVLSPNDHNSKYEAGTKVTATAQESRILKFMQWEDKTVTNPRTLTVDGDMKIVANYEVQDFIAVFDASKTQAYAYETTGNYPFPADVTWDEQRDTRASVVRVSDGSLLYSQSTGTPVVRNREGVVLSGINGLYQNGYRTSDIAWQYQFSTVGFTSARFNADMAAKNGACKTYKAQYSLDGTAFTDIEGAAWEIAVNTVNPISFDLPAAVAGQATVYVRITGTGTETYNTSYAFDKQFGGMDYCDHSESGVGNVYVTGDAEVVADETAPEVTGTIPAAGAEGVSASGMITISFDKRIQAGDVTTAAMLGDKELKAKWNSRSVSFDYNSLTYGKQYTFTLPEGYVTDRSGNKAAALTLTFTVMERQRPEARLYDAVVDASLDLPLGQYIEATEQMPRQYRYIQDAINDAPSTNLLPYLIYIKEGYYCDPNPSFNAGYGFVYKDQSQGATSTETIQIQGNGKSADGKIQYDDCRVLYCNKPNIHLIGQATDKVFIATDRTDGGDAANRSKAWYHVNAGAAIEIQEGASDFLLSTLTVDNENWTKLKKAGPQCLCLNTYGDRIVYNEINVRSYQDDYYSHGDNTRSFWYNSRLEGAVDFIYGRGDVWFENTVLDINRDKGGFIVAPDHPKATTRWGYVFNNTTITSSFYNNCQVYLGRPWHNEPMTVFLNTKMEVQPYAGYWYPTMGGLPSLWAVYGIVDRNGTAMSESSIEDYNYTDNGKVVTGKAKNYLTKEEAAQYTIANVMSGDGTGNAKTGAWNPLTVVEKTEQPVLKENAGQVTWQADPFAICYVVTVNGKPAAFTTNAQYEALVGDKVAVQSVNEHGVLSAMSEVITVGEANAIDNIRADQSPVKYVFNLLGQRQPDSKTPKTLLIVDGRKVLNY